MTDFLDPKGKYGMSFKDALAEHLPEQMPPAKLSTGNGPWWLEVVWSVHRESDGRAHWKRSYSHDAPRGFPTLYAAWHNWRHDTDRSYLVDEEADEVADRIFRIRFVYSPDGPPPKIETVTTRFDLNDEQL